MFSAETQIIVDFPDPPRKVRRAAGSGCALWVMRLFIGYMAIVALVSVVATFGRHYVAVHGQVIQATVDRRDTTTSPKGYPIHEVYYHYDVDGQRHSTHKSVDQHEYDRLKPGTQFPGRGAVILGFPVFINSDWDSSSLFDALLAPIIWGAILAGVTYVVWIHPWRQQSLIKHGEVALATITNRREKRGRGATYTLYYTFNTHSGERISGKSSVSNIVYSETIFLSQIPVFYDRRRPTRNIAYDYAEFIIS